MYTGIYKTEEQDHGLEDVLDWKLLEAAKPALESGQKVSAKFSVKNTDRTSAPSCRTKFQKNIKQRVARRYHSFQI